MHYIFSGALIVANTTQVMQANKKLSPKVSTIRVSYCALHTRLLYGWKAVAGTMPCVTHRLLYGWKGGPIGVAFAAHCIQIGCRVPCAGVGMVMKVCAAHCAPS